MKVYYRDIKTNKVQWTRGKFSHWIQGGLLNAHYAVILLRSKTLLIPIYLITKESRAQLPSLPELTPA